MHRYLDSLPTGDDCIHDDDDGGGVDDDDDDSDRLQAEIDNDIDSDPYDE